MTFWEEECAERFCQRNMLKEKALIFLGNFSASSELFPTGRKAIVMLAGTNSEQQRSASLPVIHFPSAPHTAEVSPDQKGADFGEMWQLCQLLSSSACLQHHSPNVAVLHSWQVAQRAVEVVGRPQHSLTEHRSTLYEQRFRSSQCFWKGLNFNIKMMHKLSMRELSNLSHNLNSLSVNCYLVGWPLNVIYPFFRWSNSKNKLLYKISLIQTVCQFFY